MDKSQQIDVPSKNKTNYWKISAITLLILTVGVIAYQNIYAYSNNIDEVCVPKVSGSYTPLNPNSSFGIVVLNLKDSNQLKLFQQVQLVIDSFGTKQ
jgi:hypothetical protein